MSDAMRGALCAGVVVLLVFSAATRSDGGAVGISSMSINTDTGAMSINGTPLVSGTDFTFTLVDPNPGITGGLSAYSQIGLFELTSSYLAGYDGISIDASPSLAGARPLAVAVPGNIIINASWQQNGGTGGVGTYPGGGSGGVCGGYAGQGNGPYWATPGLGPGGGGGGNGPYPIWSSGAGGSLVAIGGAGQGTPHFATVPANFHQYGAAFTLANGPVQDLLGGSAGGGSYGTKNLAAGSGGGGAVGFFSTAPSGSIEITSSGLIQVNGANGRDQYGNPGSGGGSGGTIILASGPNGTVTNNGSLLAAGGAPDGGAGAGGEIAIYYGGGSVLGTGGYSVAGGSGAGTGHYYTEQVIPATVVPEPAGLGLLGVALLAMRKRRC